jgi:membrane protein implicated in regulation of membrane protease activity
MGWFLLVLLLLAVAFGVAGAVVKATAFILLTILATIAVLVLLATLAVRYGWRRLRRDLETRGEQEPRRLTSERDDRY